jgi:dienelactone hydrolase
MAPNENSESLEGFDVEHFNARGATRNVYRMGAGPAIIVIHEIPGITPLVAEFGRTIAAAGMTAVLPDLFGTPGKKPTGGYVVGQLAAACVSREFTVLATNKTSPITTWLRDLAHHEHERCGGPGVGVVGMCLTGGFALAMMVDPVVVAPVLSQPSLPFGLSAKQRRSVGISDQDLETVKDRVADGTCVIGLRFTGDKAVPGERFARLRDELGDGFIGVEIDSSASNPWGYRKGAHSVLTEDYSDEPGSPTRVALEQVLDFYRTRLEVAASG